MKFDPTTAVHRVLPSRTVLVPLDGSPLARRALPFAVELAKRAHGRLVLSQTTWMPSSRDDVGTLEPFLRATEQHLLADLEVVATGLRAHGVQVETRVAGQAPEAGIPAAVLETGARFVVMASHGRSGLGRWFFGSVTEEVLRHSDAPVVVVPHGYTRAWSSRDPMRVLVALDGTDLAEEALAPACELAAMTGGELVLVRVVAPVHEVEDYAFPVGDVSAGLLGGPTEYLPHLQARVDAAESYLAGAADRVHGLVPSVRTRVEVGAIEDGLAGAAVATGAHVIAMATHRRGELTRLLLGSHAMATLRRVDVPVMMVRPAARGAATGQESAAVSVPRGPVTIELDAEELDLVRCGLNRLLDDPIAGEEIERSVFALEDRLSEAVGRREARARVGAVAG